MTKEHTNICPHDCWDTCSMTVTVDESGKAVKIRGNKEHPVTKGFLCIKVNNYLERVYHPDRILYPMKRTGKKGEGVFERISWEEAIQLITDKWKETIRQYGAEAVLPYSYAGTMGLINYGSMDRRFFGKMGASRLARTLCASAASAALHSVYGTRLGVDPEDMVHSRLIIAWGTNTLHTNVHQFPIMEEARRNGAVLVVIDPYRHETAEKADIHLQIKPGTDSALALGMMHVLIQNDQLDHAYIASHLQGFDELKERVKPYTPAHVASITGLSEQEIIEFTQLYASTKASLIRCGFGPQRHTTGGEIIRTLAVLPALTGAWQELGGGFLLANMDVGINYENLYRADVYEGNPREINCAQLGSALLQQDNPVKALYVYNSNPALVTPDANKVTEGLLRDDLFTVVHEQHMTKTCRYADIILPATTTLEHLDIHTSYWHLYVQLNEPAIAPLGEAKSNTETFRLLAKAMGYTEDCFADSDEDLIRQALDSTHPFLNGITYETLKEKKYQKVSFEGDHFFPFQHGFLTPSKKIEALAPQMKELGLEPLVNYTPLEQKAEGAEQYPLHFLTVKAKHFLNSSFGNVETLKKREKEPVLYMNPQDALSRGIAEGDQVKVYNDRGEIVLPAKISEKVRAGVLVTPINLWQKNVNVTTSEALTDLGGGATYYTNFVEAVKVG
ncbi:molybdopterin-containing oxidoreductase family protein [Brevibacillus laterosporus]|uniref:molybdopterin-containing oxidoreductase family protein n=1 Tax=Brevibacillus laterosporus TaxID=1465 RepID=UPI003D249FDE